MKTTENQQSSSPLLDGKWARYSAAAVGGVVGSVACFESSEAALVVTTSGITFIDDPGLTPQEFVDLDNDGTDDVLVTIPLAGVLEAQGVNGAQLAGTIGASNFFYPTAFQASQQVDSTAFFSGGTMSPTNSFGTMAFESVGVGNWLGGLNGYLGAQFETAGETYYGWVHVFWDPTDSSATLIRYAYESDPDTPAVVPEPSALALLGLGVAGLARRRRRQAAESGS